jgi:AraC-like DNA-binding protein
VRPFTTASGLGPLPDMLTEAGGKRLLRRVFADAELPLALCADRRLQLPLASMVEVFERSAGLVGDPGFGIRVGERMAPQDYGPWTTYFLAAPSLGEALRRCCRVVHCHTNGLHMALLERGDLASWTLTISSSLSTHRRHYVDHILLPMLQLVGSFAGSGWRPARLEVDYAAGRFADDIRQHLGVDVVFGAARIRVAFETQLLRCPAPSLAHAGQITQSELHATLRARPPRTFGEACRELVRARLREGATEIDPVARLLGLGVRTLQRRLRQEGTSYRAILERLRAERALALVGDTELPLGNIAAALGFADQAHFTRAFRRWTDQAPSTLRGRPGPNHY